MSVSRRRLLISAGFGIGAGAVPVTSRAAQDRCDAAGAGVPLAEMDLVSVRRFGALGDGDADDTLAAQRAYDTLAARGGGLLFFPAGRYRIALEMSSRSVHLIGEGRGATVLVPANPDGVVLRALYREGSWGVVSVRDLTIQGRDRRGVGFHCGADVRGRHDEYTGATAFTGVDFENLGTCVARPYGSIGLWVDQCRFGEADYHFWSRAQTAGPDRDAMHSGCLIVTRCHMQGFAKAMFYIDSPVDSGQVVFENNVFELGVGFVAYIRAFNDASGTPGMVFRSNWNEVTATGRDIEIEGRRHARARFLFAENVPSAIRVEDTPIGAVELVSSGVETRDCNLENLSEAITDAGSTLVHHDARRFSGTAPGRTVSLSRPVNPRGLRTPWFRMRPEAFEGRLREGASALVLDGGQPIRFEGQAVQAAGAVVLRGRQRAILAEHLTPAVGTWLVSVYVYRIVAGEGLDIDVNGAAGVTGEGRASSRSWEALVNISEVPGPSAPRVTFYHHANSATRAEVRQMALLAFQTLEQALDFVNAGSIA